MKSDFPRSLLRDIAVGACLLTRLPLPRLPDAAFDHSARAVWSYPLVGLMLGLLAAAAGALILSAGLPAMIAAGAVVVLMAIMTGAMHEDGLSDTADGFWGGHDREHRLTIMKDSHIGTYGTLALICATTLRWICYGLLLPLGAAPVLVAATLSRAAMPVVMLALPNARATGLSHSVGRPSAQPVCFGLGLAIIAALLISGPTALAAIGAAAAACCATCWIAQRKIGGQTGDVLGATQQVSEIAVLLTFVAMTAQP